MAWVNLTELPAYVYTCLLQSHSICKLRIHAPQFKWWTRHSKKQKAFGKPYLFTATSLVAEVSREQEASSSQVLIPKTWWWKLLTPCNRCVSPVNHSHYHTAPSCPQHANFLPTPRTTLLLSSQWKSPAPNPVHQTSISRKHLRWIPSLQHYSPPQQFHK